MTTPSLEKEILEYVRRLTPVQQSQVLAFAQNLAAMTVKGTPGSELLRFAGTIDQQSLDDLAHAVEVD